MSAVCDNNFETILGRYVRREGETFVILLPADDLNNLGQLVVQAIFGYLINIQMRAAANGDARGAGRASLPAPSALVTHTGEARS